VIEESDYYDDKHENKQEYVIHIINIMFDRADNNDCSASVVKRWCEELMWQSKNQVHEVKQSEIIWVSINNINNIEDNDQWEL